MPVQGKQKRGGFIMAMIPYYCRSIARRPEGGFWNDDFFRGFFAERGPWAEAFRVDVRDEEGHFLVEAELPGCTRDQIHVDVDEGVLTISCDMREAGDTEKGAYIYNERRSGRMQRSFTLTQIKEDEITAEYRDGVLHLVLPKQEQPERVPRQIDIH